MLEHRKARIKNPQSILNTRKEERINQKKTLYQ